MTKLTQAQRVLDAVNAGHATSTACSLVTDLSMRACSAWLGHLERHGAVECTGMERRKGPPAKLYRALRFHAS